MTAFFKAIPFGVFLTLLVALFMGSGGATGGMLGIFEVEFTLLDMNIEFYWSWMLFLGGTGFAFVLMLMIGD